MYKHSDFEKIGFSFNYQGETYKTIDFPTNNGSFHAVNNRGNSCIFNTLEVIEDSKYIYPGKFPDGRRRCRKCGSEIINGVNGCMLMATCTTCDGIPQYSAPSRPYYFNAAEELDILEARATSINSI